MVPRADPRREELRDAVPVHRQRGGHEHLVWALLALIGLLIGIGCCPFTPEATRVQLWEVLAKFVGIVEHHMHWLLLFAFAVLLCRPLMRVLMIVSQHLQDRAALRRLQIAAPGQLVAVALGRECPDVAVISAAIADLTRRVAAVEQSTTDQAASMLQADMGLGEQLRTLQASVDRLERAVPVHASRPLFDPDSQKKPLGFGT